MLTAEPGQHRVPFPMARISITCIAVRQPIFTSHSMGTTPGRADRRVPVDSLRALFQPPSSRGVRAVWSEFHHQFRVPRSSLSTA
jgi:hypothetical protein